ncbi:hypothetical protein FZEAL_3112 [Fusarium zealandicum]|uniref:Glucan 1, 4-alpha-glucosidase n=1 Tax=Fusarium zealandicum TaxID=1053134 RepID=A0A8H4UQ47_9HYPO|nr:hypothetical protein FZEAL_3112 [Fusarium zealandicum]
MEDPWGSPWTNDSPPKIDLPAPPPHAHFSTDHTSQRASPASTPWIEDDDAWGGWAEPGKESSPRWGRSPGLRPLAGSPAGSRLPSPGPEPWGQLAMLETARVRHEERNGDSGISLGEGLRPMEARFATRTPSVGDLKEDAADIWQRSSRAPSARSVSPLPSEDDARPGSPDGLPRPAMQRATRPTALRQPSNKVQELVGLFDGLAKRSHSVSPVDPSMRRLSSNASPVVDTMPVLDLMQEPVTIEGAEPEAEPELEQVIELLETQTHTEEEEKGDGKEVEDEVKEPLGDLDQAQAESDSWSDFESPTQEEPGTEAPQEQLSVIETTKQDEPSHKPVSTAPKPPSTPFSIDLSKLDDLFPSVPASFPEPEPVPDVIIDDSFASISERKSWYRLSRFGSMRMHDLGDDENYVRIGWGNSEVRDRAIRIVRRWMEEDSIAGRVVLGRRGGAAGSRIFNWDSSAPQLGISELLGRKSHSRQASLNSKETAASPTAASFGWSSNPAPSLTVAIPPPASNHSPITETSSEAESSPVEAANTSPVEAAEATPAFPTKSPTTDRPHSPIKPIPLQPTTRPLSISQPIPSPTSPLLPQPHSPVKPTPLRTTTRPISISQPISLPMSPLAQPPENAGWGEDDDDDDDDWGDMVSSPTDQANGFPSMDAIVDATSGDNKGHVSKPSITTSAPMEDLFGCASTEEMLSNGRHSLEAPASKGLVQSHSRSSTVDWGTSQSLMPSHSSSATVDLNGMPGSSLDALVPTDFMQNKAKSPVEKANEANVWDSWNLDSFDGATGPVGTRKDSMPTRQQLQVPTEPLEAANTQTPLTQPQQTPLPVQQPEVDTSKDDEIVTNILRDLPDLSYMLR